MVYIVALTLLVIHLCVTASGTTDSDDDATCTTAYPVNIPEVTSLKYKAAGQFKLEGFNNASTVLRKTASGFEVDVQGELYVTGGGLADKQRTFKLTLLMDNSTTHLYNNRQFVMQISIISYNTKYGNLTAAAGHTDGLSALAFWFVETEAYSNEDLVPFIQNLVKSGGRADSVKLRSIFPQYLQRFYRYHGQLGPESPNCDVTWSIFGDKLSLHTTQIELLRTMFPTSDRQTDPSTKGEPTVTRNYKLETESAAPSVYNSVFCVLCVALLTTVITFLE